MTGGYVKWYDETNGLTVLKHSPRVSKNVYIFPKNEWVRVEDETDWKFYEWKEKVDPVWESKRRLKKEETSYEDKVKARPLTDPNDPNFATDKRRKEALKEFIKKEEEVRRYFGSTLPEELKKAKKIYGGD